MTRIILALGLVSAVWVSAQTGKVGINTTAPTETFDVKGTARVQELPLHTATNALYNSAATKATTFTATRTVVADNNGNLGYINGLPGGNRKVEYAHGTLSKTQDIVILDGNATLPSAKANPNTVITVCGTGQTLSASNGDKINMLSGGSTTYTTLGGNQNFNSNCMTLASDGWSQWFVVNR